MMLFFMLFNFTILIFLIVIQYPGYSTYFNHIQSGSDSNIMKELSQNLITERGLKCKYVLHYILARDQGSNNYVELFMCDMILR